jgi:uncharacterized protein
MNFKELLKDDFDPPAIIRSPNVQTIINFFIRPLLKQKTEEEEVRTRDGDKIIIKKAFQKERKNKRTILLIHGLAGSAESSYIQRLSKEAFSKGYNAVMINLRGAGNTYNRTRKIYHAGNSSDIIDVIRQLKKKYGMKEFFIVGSSLGGNIALRTAAEAKKGKGVIAACAISPLTNMHKTIQHLEKTNSPYQAIMLRALKNGIIRKSRFYKDYDTKPLASINSLRDFDRVYQTKHNGFASVDDYYKKASAQDLLKKIHVPTLIIYSKDDPMIPKTILEGARISKNVHLLKTRYGGHVAFIGSDLKSWAEKKALEFFNKIKS